jgi:hypothetical protein
MQRATLIALSCVLALGASAQDAAPEAPTDVTPELPPPAEIAAPDGEAPPSEAEPETKPVTEPAPTAEAAVPSADLPASSDQPSEGDGPVEPSEPEFQRGRSLASLQATSLSFGGTAVHRVGTLQRGSYGVAGGFELNDYAMLVADYGYGRFERSRSVGANAAIASTLDTHTLNIGLRGQLPGRYFVPYVQASAMGLLASLELDDAPNRPKDGREIRTGASTIGLRTVAGLEFMVPVEGRVRPILLGELGYAGALSADFDTKDREGQPIPIGNIRVSGVTLRIAAGARF